jgi:hypothetical protein
MPKNEQLLLEQSKNIRNRFSTPEIPDPPLECEKHAQDSIFNSLKKVINTSFTRYELFMKLCSKLDKFFAINRASLSIYNKAEDVMKVAHILAGREYRSGVHLNLVASKTLMKSVLESSEIFTSDFPQGIDAPEIEKKILLDRDSKSIAIIPLIYEGELMGTFNMTSRSHFAFGILESHLFDYLFIKTAEKLAQLPH